MLVPVPSMLAGDTLSRALHQCRKQAAVMVSRRVRRGFMLVMLIGGPTAGWVINSDRGLMFGLAVSVLAIVWFLLEQRKIV